MSAGLDVALLSAAVALVTALLSVYATQSVPKLQARLKSSEVASRYRNPILYAAYDLQSRIYNIVQRPYIIEMLNSDDPKEKKYAVNSTLFLIAQYLAWAEAIRRGVQYVDLGKAGKTRDLVNRMAKIRHCFSTRTNVKELPFRIYRADQRAIGELMLQGRLDNQSGSMLWRCRGYAYFCAKIDDEQEQSFESRFGGLKSDVENLASDQNTARQRLIDLQHALIELIDFLDERRTYVPDDSRSKIDASERKNASSDQSLADAAKVRSLPTIP